jgi:ribonuclease P protein component
MASGADGSARGGRLLRLLPQDRLRKRFEFGRVRDQGRRIHTPGFVIMVRPGEQSRARLGITVSRKVGNAVRRNRVKRLLREVVRQQRALFPDGAELVVIARPGCRVQSFGDVQREFAKAAGALRAAAGPRGGTR